MIILVVSITPTSAALLYESDGVGVSERVMGSKVVNDSVRINMNEMQNYIDSFNCDSSYIDKRKEDYHWYNFFSWGDITYDIVNRLKNMGSAAEKIKGSADKMKENADKIKVGSASDLTNSDDVCNEDACYIADELSKRLKTHVTVSKVSASEIQEGDVVQYLSEYPHYYNVVNVKADGKSKRNIGETGEIPLLSLKCTGALIFVTHMAAYNKFDCEGVNNEYMVKTVVQIQQDDVNKIKEEAKEARNRANSLNMASKVVFGIAGLAGAISVALLVLAVLTAPTIALPIVLGSGALQAAGIGVVLGIVGGVLYGTSDTFKDKADKLDQEVYLKQKSLDAITGANGLKQETINVDTFEGIYIVKHPPMSDWKEYIAISTKEPEHGVVKYGPGLQFLYGPTEGYTGEDTFKYQYLKNGELIEITVNVHIKKAPFTQEA